MHDLSDWEEIGTLTFEVVSAADTPEMVALPVVWSDIRLIHKLMHVSDEYLAESGFALTAMNGELLTVLPAADICTLAIRRPFIRTHSIRRMRWRTTFAATFRHAAPMVIGQRLRL
ncbi:hypothetical protein [Massilia aquatica]|uniref:Uncharacterized protein n=1 Tax=Massilia aquatica TaxID=2609000 RepID=A0ABX0ME09_9BURK|nr:hypothetical protein [Massilia aquatica]NHZ42967.1 hypothetical protein [Massilia aquatica]